ncbi:hypothetical protein HN924_00220 [Candidatus Woesearchaeota archaeon]|jgi:hypothetical protein|nr:hypothetical protein [Candidatus Woesearchaeota archaeon]MBT7062376.1 hypothetical protein [Candidatus Woesearchaeota archaeon]MBT7402185.1 hypothetical protein [Candidatus Woesearchaeota archaeon]
MREINKLNFIAAFSITTLIFLAGFAFSSSIYNSKIDALQQIEVELYTDNLEIEAQYELAYSDVCDTESLITLNRDLNEMSDKMNYLEREITDESLQIILKNIKRQYFVMEIKHWLFVQRVNEECGYDYPTILFFYSNRDCPSCEIQGIILTEYKKENPNTMIYSFDTAFSESKIVKNLIEKWDITRQPSIVYHDIVFDYTVSRGELDIII